MDDDIDIYEFNQVLWAISTRVDPVKDIEVIKNCWSGPLDPIIPPGEKGYASRAIIDATKPYSWYAQFPPSIMIPPEYKAEVLKKWGGQGTLRSLTGRRGRFLLAIGAFQQAVQLRGDRYDMKSKEAE